MVIPFELPQIVEFRHPLVPATAFIVASFGATVVVQPVAKDSSHSRRIFFSRLFYVLVQRALVDPALPPMFWQRRIDLSKLL